MFPGADPGIFDWGGDGCVQTLVQKGLLTLFVVNFFLTETTTCFPICERRSPLAQEIVLFEQRLTDHWRVPQNNYISEYPCNLSLVVEYNASFIKKKSAG